MQKPPILIESVGLTISSKTSNTIKFNVKKINGYTPKLAIYGWQNVNSNIVPYIASTIIQENADTVTFGLHNLDGSGLPGGSYVAYIIYIRK